MKVTSVLAQIEPIKFFPDQASNLAPEVDALYFFLLAVTAFFSVLIFGLLIFMVIKFRRRHPDEYPVGIATDMRLELTWMFIPLLIVLVMFFWGTKLFIKMSRIPPGAMEIAVTGKQWMWNVQHQSGKREKNELHVPTGRPIKLRMTSEDVIHDFSIPAFRIKHDAVPGRYSEMWFTPTKTGTYHLFCAEYCGAWHSRMVGRVVVQTPQDYEAWLSNSIAGEAPHLAGAKLFTEYKCVTCHGQQAPTLAYMYGQKRKTLRDGKVSEVVADDNYLRRAILNPQYEIVVRAEDGKPYPPLMPTYQGALTEDQVNQLVAYIKSLDEPGSSRAEGRPADAQPLPPGVVVPDPNIVSGPRESVLPDAENGEGQRNVAPFGAPYPTTQP
jgi:cytochrome c oxidase subunit 2